MQFRRMACRLLALPGRLYRLQNEIRELRQQVIEQNDVARDHDHVPVEAAIQAGERTGSVSIEILVFGDVYQVVQTTGDLGPPVQISNVLSSAIQKYDVLSHALLVILYIFGLFVTTAPWVDDQRLAASVEHK